MSNNKFENFNGFNNRRDYNNNSNDNTFKPISTIETEYILNFASCLLSFINTAIKKKRFL